MQTTKREGVVRQHDGKRNINTVVPITNISQDPHTTYAPDGIDFLFAQVLLPRQGSSPGNATIDMIDTTSGRGNKKALFLPMIQASKLRPIVIASVQSKASVILVGLVVTVRGKDAADRFGVGVPEATRAIVRSGKERLSVRGPLQTGGGSGMVLEQVNIVVVVRC